MELFLTCQVRVSRFEPIQAIWRALDAVGAWTRTPYRQLCLISNSQTVSSFATTDPRMRRLMIECQIECQMECQNICQNMADLPERMAQCQNNRSGWGSLEVKFFLLFRPQTIPPCQARINKHQPCDNMIMMIMELSY